MRRFQLNRIHDDSGVSGTGVVAQGVEFDNGFCAMTWLTPKTSVAVYPNVKTLQSIHGHGGHTVLEWIDDDGTEDVRVHASDDGETANEEPTAT